MARTVPDPLARPLRRVIIADGDADSRSMYREALRPFHCDIVEAVEGRDALVQCLIQPPALLITDTYLSAVDGYQLCQLLRRDRATRFVPILILTSEGRPAELARLRLAGATSVLSKPFPLDGFRADVLRLVEAVEPAAADAAANAMGSRRAASRTFRRFETTAPPHLPPVLHCRQCDRLLAYQRSKVGGVSQRSPEQWDQFRCPACDATFEYRHRTRRLRKAFD